MRGYVSMRNEDGTQWYVPEVDSWSESKRDARPVSEQVFAIMESRVDSTRDRDCPDNGFFGVYRLAFHPIKERGA